jgi:hypothetical protein
MYDDLIKLGCLEHKTFLLKFPTNEQVPQEFIYSFILGLWDGDGSITICTPRKETHRPAFSISLTGTKEILEGVKSALNLSNSLLQRFPERKNNNYTLQVSGTQKVAKILDKIYSNAPSFCLKRKYNKYISIINDSRVKL